MHDAAISVSGEQSPRTHGNYRIILSLPVDGGFAINVHAATGDHRYHELSFTTADVDTANLAYRTIAEGADNGVGPEGIRQALDDALRAELLRVQQRHDTPSRQRVAHINALLDLMESPVDTAKVAELVESLSQPTRPRTFRELRDTHAAAAARDRAQLMLPQQFADRINTSRRGA